MSDSEAGMWPTMIRSTLVLVAVACLAGVFAIHRIESAGSPVGAPALSRSFSPNADGMLDTAVLTFTVPRTRHIDVWVTRVGSTTRIASVATNMRAHGATRLEWDGTTTPGTTVTHGSYLMFIHVRELGRTFPVTRPVVADVTPPHISNIRLRPGHGQRVARLSWTSDGDTVGRRVEVGDQRVTNLVVTRKRARDGRPDTFELVLDMRNGITYEDLVSRGVLVVTDHAGNHTTARVGS